MAVSILVSANVFTPYLMPSSTNFETLHTIKLSGFVLHGVRCVNATGTAVDVEFEQYIPGDTPVSRPLYRGTKSVPTSGHVEIEFLAHRFEREHELRVKAATADAVHAWAYVTNIPEPVG